MSFRARLRLFFVLLVIVPMIVLTIVLFTLVGRSETGKADAGISTGVRLAFGIYQGAADRAEPALRQVAADERLRSALESESEASARMRQLLGGPLGIDSIALYAPGGEVVAHAGPGVVAPQGAPLSVGGRRVGVLAVSLTGPDELTARVRDLTGYHVAVYRGGRLLSATTGGLESRGRLGEAGEPHDLELGGEDYRGRVERIGDPAGAVIELAMLRSSDDVSESVAERRLVIGGLLLAFLMLAALAAAAVSRSLNGQIGKLLDAARRLAHGDFSRRVPVRGRDEFAELGREFNSMSDQLEAKIEEVERKRAELAQTIRRVGDALATGLDRDGLVALAVRQAVDACEADAGRAWPRRQGAFGETRSGLTDPRLDAVMESAEREAFSAERPSRRAVGARDADAHALAAPLRAVLAAPGPDDLGVLTIARRGLPFTREQEEMLEYLAGQAVISIENASLHETVERQAVTDELTGLANVRAFQSILEREVERSRRFQTPLSLVMVDLDHFKSVNDDYGHQQGDEVLASVAGVLRELSRDIDAPARYGGEELAVVVPQTDSVGAEQLAERMREAIERLEVPRTDGQGFLQVTASFGVAAMPESAGDREELVAAADAALYRAKRGGRNRVERAEPVPAAG